MTPSESRKSKENIMIEFREISILSPEMRECIELRVTKEQEEFVASNAYSLAEAYVDTKLFNETGGEDGAYAVPFAIYEDGKMVGFVMYSYCNDENLSDTHHYYVWRLFVDKNHQGRGIGKKALAHVMNIIKTKPHGPATHCYSSYDPENKASQATFAAYGFKEDGREVDGETVAYYLL